MSDEEESLLKFPCEFLLKVIGHDKEDFVENILCIVDDHIKDFDREQISVRNSQGAKYLALSISFIAESKPQMDALYMALNNHEHVVMVL